MDRGAWLAIVRGVTKESDMTEQLSMFSIINFYWHLSLILYCINYVETVVTWLSDWALKLGFLIEIPALLSTG